MGRNDYVFLLPVIYLEKGGIPMESTALVIDGD